MRVLSLIDTLVAAGAERMAVNIANALNQQTTDVYSYLCATHVSGPLAEFFYDEKRLLIAHKKSWRDFNAFFKIVNYVRKHQIQIIHAHSSSVYWACLLRLMMPKLKVVWHDHFGFSDYLERRTSWALKLCRPMIDHVFVVNHQLYQYAIEYLGFSMDQVTLLLNFPDLDFDTAVLYGNLPNSELNPKYICLANIRPQKDHPTLLSAFAKVKEVYTNAQLYLVGGDYGDDYLSGIKQLIRENELISGHVHLLGSRNDVAAILKSCHVGVLSSISEGLPVALLEYGLAKLPVICTRVGECGDVLADGKFGLLVDARQPQLLADAMLKAATVDERVGEMADAFYQEVFHRYSKQSAIKKIMAVYSKIAPKVV